MHLFDQLAWQVKEDDLRAAARMQQELEERMIPMVRRALRRGVGDSPINRRILVEAERILPAGIVLPDEERERRIARIARRVSAAAVGKLRPQALAPRQLLETVPA